MTDQTDTAPKGLTHQQEAFARAVAEGSNQSAAYRLAYPKSRAWKDSAVWPQASRLLATPKVSARITAIRFDLVERGLWAREKSVKTLADIATNRESVPADIIRAVVELNKMHGYNAPEKVEHSGSLGGIRLVIEGVEPGHGTTHPSPD